MEDTKCPFWNYLWKDWEGLTQHPFVWHASDLNILACLHKILSVETPKGKICQENYDLNLAWEFWLTNLFFSLCISLLFGLILWTTKFICYLAIKITCYPPLLLIDSHSTNSLSNFTLVHLEFPKSDLLQIPEAFHCLYKCLQICNFSDRQIWQYFYSDL